MTRFCTIPMAVAALATAAAAQNLGATFLNTVDGFLEVPYSPAVVPQSGITFEAWITYDDATLPTGWRYPTIMRQGNSGGGSENMFLRVDAHNSGNRVLTWKVVTATSQVNVSWPFAAGQLLAWTHIACTYDGAASTMFVNGVPVASAAGIGAPIRDANTQTLRIGKGDDIGTPMEVWNGSIDEVRLWPFARTQAEIQATMNQQLAGVPGRVSTWNLDGHAFDTSGGQHAAVNGTVAWTTNPLVLAAPAAPTAIGTSTAGCLGAMALAPTCMAQANAPFAWACTRTPAGAIGVFGVSLGTLPQPIPVLGIDVWIDPTVLATATGIADGLGTMRLSFPIPAGIPAGVSFAAQTVVLDPCGAQGFTASDAMSVVVVP
ncbi:MAG: LamG domain-containing protein [Planctomycetes bacterium]|nr:LamG domain-containing protein [Planctomycetota bacterium]